MTTNLEPTVSTRDGLTLQRRCWPVDRARGTLLLVHGIAEHSGRYEHVARHLNLLGWRVESYDQRGHGLSQGEPGRLVQDDDLLHDLDAVVRVVRHEQPDAPLVLMGHSLGGLVVSAYVAGFNGMPPSPSVDLVDALVVVSPPYKVAPSFFQHLLLQTLARWVPDMCVSTRFDPVAISRDPEVVKAYQDDPLVHDRISGRLARFIVNGGAQVLAKAPQWRMPTLLLYAGADRIASPDGSAQFARTAPSELVRARVFSHMAHEVLNEPDRAKVLDELHLWLDAQLPRKLAAA